MFTMSSLFVTLLSTTILPATSNPAHAYDKTFPSELTGTDSSITGDTTIVLESRQRPTPQQPQQQQQPLQSQTSSASTSLTMDGSIPAKNKVVQFTWKEDSLPSLIWGSAFWLWSGSRSNPLATPLANVLYDASKEPWLQDRNDGLFASPPIPFLLLLGILLGGLGCVFQWGVVLPLTEGNHGLTIQLACVSLIGGAFIELGRTASGEKQSTRQEQDRQNQLQDEFETFARQRLLPGGNCHRTDVVSAFRRFYAKYRQADSEQYPLTDLEIEQLLRDWNKTSNQGRAEMTSGGFYYGIQINSDADVFVSRRM